MMFSELMESQEGHLGVSGGPAGQGIKECGIDLDEVCLEKELFT